MRLLLPLLSTFFRLLYHQLAWCYDLVAAIVSLGRWQRWVKCALPYLGGRVLEIGPGPGHLQEAMHKRGWSAFGVEESWQMCRQVGRRMQKSGYPLNIIRGCAQALPILDNTLETVVATFPAEYIFEAVSLAESRRVLRPGGRLVLLPAAWITGKGLPERLMAWLFRVTGQARAIEAILPGMVKRIQAGGFEVQHETVDLPGSRVLVILARKSAERIS